jgi:hypothetical protein
MENPLEKGLSLALMMKKRRASIVRSLLLGFPARSSIKN